MKTIIYLVLFSIFSISCGNQSTKLTISKFQIVDENGIVGINVSNDGTILLESAIKCKIKPTGEIFDNKDSLLAKITGDKLIKSNGELICRINQNGTMENGSDETIKWNSEGELVRGKEKTGFKIIPNDPKLYRAASIIFFLMTNFEPSQVVITDEKK